MDQKKVMNFLWNVIVELFVKTIKKVFLPDLIHFKVFCLVYKNKI
jgi:hypothetical protein